MAILALPPPVPITRAAPGAPPARVFRRQLTDQAQLTFDRLTVATISSALAQARQGHMAALADVLEWQGSHPHVRGVRGQLIAGVQSVEQEVVPADDSPLAAEIAEWTRDRWFAAHPSRSECIGSVANNIVAGQGLTEPIWSTAADGSRVWSGFVPVPLQRIRFDRATGVMGYASDRYTWESRPISSFEPGTFLAVETDRHVLDYSLRGVDRAVMNYWFPLLKVGGWAPLFLERYGMPILQGKTDDPTDRTTLEEAFEKPGTDLRLVTGTKTELVTAEKTLAGIPHLEYTAATERGISVTYLGASQTVNVDPGAGSKQTSGDHMQVRKETLQTICGGVSEVVDRDLFEAAALVNWGEQARGKGAHLVFIFPKPIDVLALLTGYEKAVALGIAPTEADAREALGWRQPRLGEKLLGGGVYGETKAEPAPTSGTPALVNGPQQLGPRGIVPGGNP